MHRQRAGSCEVSRANAEVTESKGPGKRGHIVADTNVSPFAPARATQICVAADTNFVSATNVSQFAQSKKHHGQQCVLNNVSSFNKALKLINSNSVTCTENKGNVGGVTSQTCFAV